MYPLNSYKAKGTKKYKVLDSIPVPRIQLDLSVGTLAELLKMIMYITIALAVISISSAVYSYYTFKKMERISVEEYIEDRLVPIIARQQELENIFNMIESNYIYVPYTRGNRKVLNAVIMNGPNKGKTKTVVKHR